MMRYGWQQRATLLLHLNEIRYHMPACLLSHLRSIPAYPPSRAHLFRVRVRVRVGHEPRSFKGIRCFLDGSRLHARRPTLDARVLIDVRVLIDARVLLQACVAARTQGWERGGAAAPSLICQSQSVWSKCKTAARKVLARCRCTALCMCDLARLHAHTTHVMVSASMRMAAKRNRRNETKRRRRNETKRCVRMETKRWMRTVLIIIIARALELIVLIRRFHWLAGHACLCTRGPGAPSAF